MSELHQCSVSDLLQMDNEFESQSVSLDSHKSDIDKG